MSIQYSLFEEGVQASPGIAQEISQQFTTFVRPLLIKLHTTLDLDTMPSVVVRRETRPGIPDAVGKNLEGDSWVIVFT